MTGGPTDDRDAAGEPPSVIFERPPNRIAGKVSKGGPDAVTEHRLAALDEHIVAKFGDQYLEWVENDLVRLREALNGIKAGADVDAPSVKAFRAIIHDMRGMGGTFEYDLVTTIADQVHRLVHAVGTLGGDHLLALRVHVDALKVVVAERLTGDGGDRGREVLDGLQKVYQKYV